MVNFRHSTKPILALILVIFSWFGGEPEANQTYTAPSSISEPPAITLAASQTPSTSPTMVKSEVSVLGAEAELKILKEKNTLISDFQSSLIAIVIWSLSAVVSVVILLVGASLFTNFKMHEKDVQRIQIDYDAKIKIFKSEIEANIAKAAQEMANAQEARSQQDLDRMLDQAAQVRSQFETVRLALESRLERLSSDMSKFESELGSIKKTQIALRAELRKAETRIWEIKKIPENVLISSLQGLDAALASKNKWQIEDFAEQIKQVIKSDFIEKKLSLDEELQKFISTRLNKLTNEHPEHAIEIKQLVNECLHINPA
ncbi:hypothetical protein [Pseudomonas fluorescens]|uniref:hypothetical protein n=1 Tax=Pseudomonas fluorescens TaxID=294 RepID=UPI00117A8AA1|nr:hypothetical protein [Pseudomonas fluorescens]